MKSQGRRNETDIERRDRKKRYRKVVTCLAAVVVFVTTYALVLPAMTLDDQKADKTPGIDTGTKVEESVGKDGSVDKKEQDVNKEESQKSDGEKASSKDDPAKGGEANNPDQNKKNDSSAEKKDQKKSDADPEGSGSAVKDSKKDSEIELIKEKTELTYEGNGYKIVAEVGEDAKLPADTKLKVKEIKKDTKDENGEKYDYDAYCEDALKAVRNKDGEEAKDQKREVMLFDISFDSETVKEGNLEPEAPVKVKIVFDKALDTEDKGMTRAVHFDKRLENLKDEEREKVKKEVLDTKAKGDKKDEMKEASFKSDKFSVYGFVYTTELKQHVLTASGDTYEVTVSYGEDAGIPEDAELYVEEIAKDDEAYSQFREDVAENLEDGTEDIPKDPELLDISIRADGEEIEPAEGSDVKVEIKMDKDSVSGLYTDEDTPLLVNDEPITDEMGEIDNSMQVIHRVEDGKLEVMDTDDTISGDEVSTEFTTGSFSDWLLFLDETVENIQIGVNDSLTLRPYSKWVWKRAAEEEKYQNYQWVVPSSSNVITFTQANKTDDQLNETYTYYHGAARTTGTFDLQLKDGDTVVHTIHVTVVGDVPDTPGTIQGSNDIKVNLFDYDINTQDRTKSGPLDREENVASSADYRNTSVNKYSDLQFLGYGGSNTSNEWFQINNYTKDVPNQGILQNKLINGFPQLGPSANGQGRGQPSLAYLFNTSSRNNDVYAYPNVTGLFQKDSEGYYFYNSNCNYAYYDTSSNNTGNSITLYEHTYSQWTSGSAGPNAKPIGFFPFHQYDSYLKEGNTGMNFNTNLNHHFGMSMAVDFEIPSDGLDDHGNPITFEFSGDDDMWVFIDDNLVLDVGGIHQPVTGRINFSADKVEVYGVDDTTITQRFEDAGSDKAWAIGDGQPHTMKIFYLERGGCDSNLSVKFNTPTRFGKGKLSLVKREKNTTTPIRGAKFAIWDNAKCEGEPIREFTSDQDGKIEFGEFVIKSATDTYYMKEAESANGYLRDTSVYEVKPRLDSGGNVVKDSGGDYIILDVYKKGSSTPLEKLENDSVIFPNTKSEKINIPVKKTWVGGDPVPGAQVQLTIKRYKLIDKVKGFIITKSVSGEPEGYNFDADYTITYPDGTTKTVSYSQFNDGVYGLEDAVPGDYTVVENVKSSCPEGYDMTHDPANNTVNVTLEEDGTAQANFRTTIERQKGDLYIKANLAFQNGSSDDIDYSRVKYAVLDANGKKVASITHQQALTGTTLQLPTGTYSVKSVSIPDTPTNYDRTVQKVVCGSREEDGTIIKNITVSKNQQTEVDFNTTYVKRNNAQNCRWKIIDQYSDSNNQEIVYKSGKVEYPVGTKVRMSFKVPQGRSALHQVTYDGQTLEGHTTNTPDSMYEYSVEFVVKENAELSYSINVFYNKNIDITGPTFEVVSHAKSTNSASSGKASSGSRKALKANTLNLGASNPAKHPDAPEGKKYIKDPDWSETVTLNAEGWEKTLNGLPATDDEGNKYYYYVDSVTESGLGDGTVGSIDLDGTDQLLIGQDLNNGEGFALGVTNKRSGSLKITKDVTVNDAAVTDHSKASPADGQYTFKIRKKNDDSFAERTVTITIANGNANTTEIGDLQAGTYIIEEVVPTNGTELTKIDGQPASQYTAEVTVVAGMIGNNAPGVTFTNNIVDTSLTIVKKDSNTKTTLEGAKFTLTRVKSSDHSIVQGQDAYSREETSDGNGRLQFTGLKKGCYQLEETFVPAGYVTKEGPYYITIGSDGSGALDTSVAHTMISPDSGNVYTVENEPGPELPSSGGPGTTWMYLIGSLLTLMAGVTLAARRRMRV